MSDKNFDAMNSAGVTLSNSQFFSVWRILVHKSSAVPFGSRIISKKSARIRNLFLSRMKWSRNNDYNLFMFILFGSLSLTVFSRRFRRKSRLLQWLVFFSSVQRVTSTFCALIQLMHIYQLLPYVLNTSFSTHPKRLT